jgi:hypothetical protein
MASCDFKSSEQVQRMTAAVAARLSRRRQLSRSMSDWRANLRWHLKAKKNAVYFIRRKNDVLFDTEHKKKHFYSEFWRLISV